MPASAAISAMRNALSEVCRAGFSTTLLPAAKAGPIFHAIIWIGKFHGRMQATTPIGSRTISDTTSGPDGEVRS